MFSTDDLAGFLQAKARQGWLVAGTVGCPGPEISPSSEIPTTSCLEFLWDRPTLLVLARGRGSLWRGRESTFSKTPENPQPHPKGPEWRSTQDWPQDQNKRGGMGADLD